MNDRTNDPIADEAYAEQCRARRAPTAWAWRNTEWTAAFAAFAEANPASTETLDWHARSAAFDREHPHPAVWVEGSPEAKAWDEARDTFEHDNPEPPRWTAEVGRQHAELIRLIHEVGHDAEHALAIVLSSPVVAEPQRAGMVGARPKTDRDPTIAELQAVHGLAPFDLASAVAWVTARGVAESTARDWIRKAALPNL